MDDDGLLLRFSGRNREIDQERGLPRPFCEITATAFMHAWCHDAMRLGMHALTKVAPRLATKRRTGARLYLVEWNSLLPEGPRRDLC